MLRPFAFSGVFLGLLAIAGLSTAGGNKARHPHLHHALHELREARTELKEAAHDFGGHRAKALEATDAAIAEIDLALKGAGDNIKGQGAREKDFYKKYSHYPHIHHAVHELKEARTELKEAAHDFGGHRERALRDVNRAIEQLELAIKFAKKNS
ncbi:MAG: hypothetical protein HY040_04435 [Planctomycetes bacterium]|nr:hypothetical protein [Planctomycetota bacterium]